MHKSDENAYKILTEKHNEKKALGKHKELEYKDIQNSAGLGQDAVAAFMNINRRLFLNL